MKEEVVVFWFRRDLRLRDNRGLSVATSSDKKVLPLFIFDENILGELDRDDARVTFIYDQLASMHEDLNGALLVKCGDPIRVWERLLQEFTITEVHTNNDYEPYAISRDMEVAQLLESKGITFQHYKDQVIFEPGEILKDDGTPLKVYTPFKKRWLANYRSEHIEECQVQLDQIYPAVFDFPSLADIGFRASTIHVRPFRLDVTHDYQDTRDTPSLPTSDLSPHLRFGTVSIREILRSLDKKAETYLSELIWREFFVHILAYYPDVVNRNFKSKYDGIQWRNDPEDFEKWCQGKTGYPMVDAGMRQLNETGYMHNRVRMVVASFLCKHLLIHWSWGEAYFAKKLLDFDLSANNGNWQWVAGTGCDAAPYFRVFNPTEQAKKFDPKGVYMQQWIKDLNELSYPRPMVEHKVARERALKIYKEGLANANQSN